LWCNYHPDKKLIRNPSLHVFSAALASFSSKVKLPAYEAGLPGA
jgi:hypothetical protein